MQVSAVLNARSSLQMGSHHLIGVPPEGPSDHVLLEDLRRVLRIADRAAQRARASARAAARAGGSRASYLLPVTRRAPEAGGGTTER